MQTVTKQITSQMCEADSLKGLGEKDAHLSTSGNEWSLRLKAKGSKKRRFILKFFPMGVWAIISENTTHV